MINTCLLIDTKIKGSTLLTSPGIIKELWNILCEKFPILIDTKINFEESKLVNNIQCQNNVTIQFVLEKIPSDTTMIVEMVSVIENYFLSYNLACALPISIRAMSKHGSRIRIDNLI